MQEWQFIVLLVVLLGAVALGVWLAMRKQQTQRRYAVWNAQADVYMNAALDNLGVKMTIHGRVIDKIWGRRVALFSFESDELPSKAALAPALKVVSEGHAVLSDYWQTDAKVHADVALLVNDETRKYLEDLKRIKHHNG
ncbi:MAG: hypothetical protein LKG24_00680 [Lacticaseibacillus songhuajiangensis]|jgi:hypothetical protein|nr:hypothetical protein [Lacticaseibacillus songhuajiangensis]